MAFVAPQGNKTVMVDNSNNIVYPASFQKVVATQATIAGNNFTSVPSVIDPENATKTQLPSVASVVSYVSDVVEGGSSGLIPAIQSDIQTLGQVKSNRGEFWFEGGALSTTNKMPLNAPFTCVWTMAMTQEEFILHKTYYPKIIGNIGYWASASYGYGWSINRIGKTLIGIGANNGGGSEKYNNLDITNYLDGNPHIWSVVYDETNISLYIDNVKKTSFTYTFESSEATNPLGIGSMPTSVNQDYGVWGKFSRIKYFNFDMYADDAPYTIDDYISGKDESPLLNQPNPTQDWHIMPTGFSRDASTGKITMTNTSTVNSYPFALGTLLQGVSYKINVNGSILNASGTDAMRLYLPTDRYTITRTNITTGYTETKEYTQDNVWLFNTDGNEWDVEITFVCNANSTNSNAYLRANAVNTSRENYFYFSAEKIGSLLSLDDYSIKVGATQIVPDVSSNNNDATITGAVYGSKDNSIAEMAQLFYQSQQG